jgi:hypothetical protein
MIVTIATMAAPTMARNLSTEPGRSFFQLSPLPFDIVVTLVVIAAVWTWAVLHIHRTRVVQRGIDVLIAGWRRMRPVGLRAGV